MTLSNMTLRQKYGSIAQIIPNRLYFASFDSPPSSDNNIVYLNIDESVHYDAFYDDFGPLNLAVLYRFCESLHTILQSKEKRKFLAFTSSSLRNRVNGAFLVAAYMVIYHNLTSDQAYVRIQAVEPPVFVGFRDAAMGHPTYLLHVQHVIKGVEKALQFGWLNFKTFDPDEYEFYERVENGDLNWIIPDKILSFCGPHDRSYTENEYCYHAPEVYFDYFRDHNVSTIVRLNRKIYDAKRFVNAGFEHVDLFFIDGSTPSDEIVLKFIDVVEKARGAVAIHCKAGLGRTGTLIACWMMKNFKITASQCIAWLRICRPGSVIGPQQQFLLEKQLWCCKLGRKGQHHSSIQPNILACNASLDTSSKKSVSSTSTKLSNNSLLQAHNIKCKITNNNTSNNNEKSKILVTRLANELDDFGFTEIKTNSDLNYVLSSKQNKTYSLRSQKSGTKNVSSTLNGYAITNDFDETIINEFGQSQGDRLCEMKAKAQHHKGGVTHPFGEQIDHSKLARLPPTTITAASKYSSATTPIKQLKLSTSRKAEPTSTYQTTHRSSVSAGYRNLNVNNRIPISKVTVATNCRPSILRTETNKKFLALRNKPYSPASRVALDFAKFNAGLLNKSDKPNAANFARSNSTSAMFALYNKNSSALNYQLTLPTSNIANKKYELRSRVQFPSRFDPATTLSPNINAVLSSPKSHHVLPTSKSFSKLL